MRRRAPAVSLRAAPRCTWSLWLAAAVCLAGPGGVDAARLGVSPHRRWAAGDEEGLQALSEFDWTVAKLRRWGAADSEWVACNAGGAIFRFPPQSSRSFDPALPEGGGPWWHDSWAQMGVWSRCGANKTGAKPVLKLASRVTRIIAKRGTTFRATPLPGAFGLYEGMRPEEAVEVLQELHSVLMQDGPFAFMVGIERRIDPKGKRLDRWPAAPRTAAPRPPTPPSEPSPAEVASAETASPARRTESTSPSASLPPLSGSLGAVLWAQALPQPQPLWRPSAGQALANLSMTLQVVDYSQGEAPAAPPPRPAPRTLPSVSTAASEVSAPDVPQPQLQRPPTVGEPAPVSETLEVLDMKWADHAPSDEITAKLAVSPSDHTESPATLPDGVFGGVGDGALDESMVEFWAEGLYTFAEEPYLDSVSTTGMSEALANWANPVVEASMLEWAPPSSLAELRVANHSGLPGEPPLNATLAQVSSRLRRSLGVMHTSKKATRPAYYFQRRDRHLHWYILVGGTCLEVVLAPHA